VSDTALSKPDKELALRDYQRDLLTRTQSAQQSSSVSQKRLAFSAGGYRWLIQMENAIEIMPMPHVVPVPGTYDWLRGLMNYRGRLVSVIDFNRLLAGPEASKNNDDRLIILSDRLR
jgi:twitching motility protein PilI